MLVARDMLLLQGAAESTDFIIYKRKMILVLNIMTRIMTLLFSLLLESRCIVTSRFN